jgi:hypothetical protein
MDKRVVEIKEEAWHDLAKLYGLPPYGRSNLCYADGMFAKSLEEKYGMNIDTLISWTKFEKDPYDIVIKQLQQWITRFDDKDRPERTTHVSKGTLEDMYLLMTRGTTKK